MTIYSIRNKSVWAMMMALCVMASMTACDDDESGDEPDLAAAVIGTYEGDGLYVFPYMPSGMAYAGLTVAVARHDDEKDGVDVTFEHATLGNFKFAGARVTRIEDGYTLYGDGEVVMSRARYNKPDTTYSAIVNATIYSADEFELAHDFEFVFSTPDVMGGSAVTIRPAQVTPASSLAGAYTGTMQWNVNGQDFGEAFAAKIEVVGSDDTTLSLGIPAMAASERMQTEAFVIEGVTYTTDAAGRVTLDETDYELTAAGGMVYRGSVVSGSIVGGKLAVKFSLRPGAMPMPIICTFQQN